MANLTLSIDEQLLRRARIRALERGTTVNAVVREFLQDYATDVERLEARRELVELARASAAGTPGERRSWTREELYESLRRWRTS